jgi:hypothetical protein
MPALELCFNGLVDGWEPAKAMHTGVENAFFQARYW